MDEYRKKAMMRNNNIYNEAKNAVSDADRGSSEAVRNLADGGEMYAREVVRLTETVESALKLLAERGVSESDLRLVRRGVFRDEQDGYCYVFFDPTSANTNTYAYSTPFATRQGAWGGAMDFAQKRWPGDETVSAAVSRAAQEGSDEPVEIYSDTAGNRGPLSVQVVLNGG